MTTNKNSATASWTPDLRTAAQAVIDADDDHSLCQANIEVLRAALAAPAQAATAKQSPHPEYDKGFSDGWNRCEERQAAAPAQAGEREAFEAWVAASGRAHMLKRDDRNDWYADLTVTAWWTAWQASAARGAAPAPSASVEQEAMQMLWNDQQQEEKEHYRNVARGAERIE